MKSITCVSKNIPVKGEVCNCTRLMYFCNECFIQNYMTGYVLDVKHLGGPAYLVYTMNEEIYMFVI